MLFIPQLFTGYRGENTSGLSPRLWAKVYGSMMSPDGADRLIWAADDFLNPKASSTYTVLTSELAYTGYISNTGDTLTGVADESGGVLALYNTTNDNDEVWLHSGDATSVFGAISDTAGSDFLTAFECRVKVNSIADDVASIFCGLAEEGTAADNTKANDTGVLASKDYIGFNTVHVNAGTAGTNALVNFVYRLAGQTAVAKISTVHTFVADDFVKLGFLYDPAADTSKRIKVFVNNVEQSTYVTGTNIAVATGSAFPDGEEMGFLAGVKSGSTTPSELSIDWWAYAQLMKPATN
jgi:hypothetical protein